MINDDIFYLNGKPFRLMDRDKKNMWLWEINYNIIMELAEKRFNEKVQDELTPKEISDLEEIFAYWHESRKPKLTTP